MHIIHAMLGHLVLWMSIGQTINLLILDNWHHKYRWDSITNNCFILLTIFLCISGQYTQSVMAYYNGDKPWSKTERVTMVGKVHRIAGYCMLFGGNLVCALGTTNYIVLFVGRKDLIFLGPLSFGIFCVTVLISELIYRRVSGRSFMKLTTPEAGTKIHKETIRFYTPHELDKEIEKGKHLVVLDNLILDLNGYERLHPGGKFLITKN